MVSKWENGADTVKQKNQELKDKDIFSRQISSFFNKMCSGVMPKDSGTFGLMNKKVAQHVRMLNDFLYLHLDVGRI